MKVDTRAEATARFLSHCPPDQDPSLSNNCINQGCIQYHTRAVSECGTCRQKRQDGLSYVPCTGCDGHDCNGYCAYPSCKLQPSNNRRWPKDRKASPLATGLIDYFPDALIAVAACSHTASAQHKHAVMRWDRTKSTDEDDALMRHFVERGTVDSDGVRHSTKVAWRALALLQKEIENGQGATGTQEPRGSV